MNKLTQPSPQATSSFQSTASTGASTPALTRRSVLSLGATAALAPVWLAGCGGSSAPGYSATIADARAAILKALADSNTPSISVALMDRERVIWAEAFGTIDKAANTAPSTETLFCIGSCSKMLATLSVMMLVERGLVVLDAPLVRYLPAFKMASPEYTQITVRMLINHSSGFPGADYRGAMGTVPSTSYATQVMQTLASVRLKHAPGEMSVYCNDGFTMVEPLVHALTGKTYPQFVMQEILAPLGMLRSRYATEAFPSGSFAPGYSADTQLPQEFVNPYASGGLYTTPVEMGRLAMMLLNGGQLAGKRYLSADAIAEMARNQTVTQPLRPVAMADGFGLGWDGVRQDGLAAVGITAWHKGGATTVYGSDFFVLPDEGLALMITGTSMGYGSGALAERILLQALIESRRLAAMPTPLSATPGPLAIASDALLADLSGIYADYRSVTRIQAQADRTLAVSKYAAGAWSTPPTILKLRSDGSFSSDAAPNVAYLSVLTQGLRHLILRFPYGMGHYRLEIPYLQKLNAKAALSAAWQGRLGRQWLAVNEPPDSLGLMGGNPVFTLASVPDLPGYVLASAVTIDKYDQVADASTSDSAALMCLTIPWIQGSRDLDDVVILSRGGEEWVRVGSSIFRPQQTVLTMPVGSSLVTIGAEAYAEWRRMSVASALSVSGASAWKLFDADLKLLDAGSTDLVGHSVPAGSYVLLYGVANVSVQCALVQG